MTGIPKPPCVDGYEFENAYINSKGNLNNAALYQNCKNLVYTHQSLNGKFIEEAIGDAYLRWNNQTPVLIDAPTGSGKSTFVCQKLIREAAERGSTLLLLSNRAALVRQQKIKVAEVASEYDRLIDPNAKDSIIDEYAIWGNVCICTYHGLMSLLRAAEYNPYYSGFLANLMYTVCDEVHFLYADAVFANPCAELLEKIPAYFYYTIRVYMTATSWSILESLIKAEKNVGSVMERSKLRYPVGCYMQTYSHMMPPRHKFLHYDMPANYDRYNLHFFSANGSYELTNNTVETLENRETERISKGEKAKKKKINKALETLMECLPQPTATNKLLVFVRRREDGRSLESAWKDKGVNAVFIDRTSKIAPEPEYDFLDSEKARKASEEQEYKNKVWNQLLRDERFNEEVLIATSVLDCGINIHDPAVRTIACFADEPTAFIQMLGRKRMSGAESETVDVWVYVPNARHFSQIAEMKELELELAEKLDFIRDFQNTQTDIKPGKMVTSFLSKNGSVELNARDDIFIQNSYQYIELLSRNYATRYEGANFREVYYRLWSNYSRISDKQLFYFDNLGQPYVNHYVKWIVEEQKRYYGELAAVQDYRMVVTSWMGKHKDLTFEREDKMQELTFLLDQYCQHPIPDAKRDDIRTMIVETALLYLDDNSMKSDWSSMTPKRLNSILNALGLHYEIERVPGTRSKDWRVSKKDD